ncbi:MAG: hypothetical protein NZ822_02230, partial [Patescibacteria group bacterium]|nr:hypothetical protein [Patescibacteria group bacterium]
LALVVILIIPPILNMINPQIFRGVDLVVPRMKINIPDLEYNPDIPGSFPGAGTPFDRSREFDPLTTKQGCAIPWNHKHCAPRKIYQIIGKRMTDERAKKELAIKMSLICMHESGGDPSLDSITDKCKSTQGEYKKGPAFSFGLFQINLTVKNFSYRQGGQIYQCRGSEIFTAINYECQIKNIELYKRCSNILKNPFFNTYLAVSIAQGANGLNNWSKWVNGVHKCFELPTGSEEYRKIYDEAYRPGGQRNPASNLPVIKNREYRLPDIKR